MTSYIKLSSTETCNPQSVSASQCRVATAGFLVSGDGAKNATDEIRTSLDSIFENDEAFDDELLMKGIVDVRLRDVSSENALNAPLRSGNGSVTARPAVVAVLSVAACTVVAAAVMVRRFGLSPGVDKTETDSDSDSYDETVPATMAASTTV